MELVAYDEAEALSTLLAQGTSALVSSKLGQILVVDDEVELKNALVEVLNAQGYDALGCTSGTEALLALREQNFDVLLSDLMMPGMDGVALLRAALEIDQNLVCIIMTGQGTIQTAVDAMKVGAFDYVLKPFQLQALLPVLTRAINVRLLRQENLQLRETVAIYELCQTIAFTLDRQTLLSKLADAALQQSEADELSILLLTADGSELYVAAVRGENRTRLLDERVPLEQGISSWVARERTPLLLKGQVNDARFTAMWPRADIRSAISVPLQTAGKLVGIINVNNISSPRPFTLGQMKALTILASAAAAALESTSLYERVRQAERNYHSIFENAVEGIFQSTPEGRFITVNPSLARILGYDSPEEVIETITDITHQLYVDPERRVEATLLQDERGVLQGYEFEAYRKDGEKIWLSENRRAVRDENGVELYREGTLEDITESKQVAAALEASEGRYRDLVENARDIIYTHDLKGSYTSINKAGEQITGYTREETLGLNLAQTVAPDYLEKARRMISGKLASEEETVYDLEIIAKDGHRIALEVNTRLVFQDDVPVGVQGIAREVTERKRAEEEKAQLTAQIESQRQRLNNIIANVPGVVWEAWGEPNAKTQRIDFVSGHVETMLGYSMEEWLSTPNFWLTIVHPDDREQAGHATAEDFARGKSSGPLEFRWVTKDGRAIWVESNYAVITDDEGQAIGLRGVNTDISARKQAEEAVRESEERYRVVAETATDVIVTINESSTILFANGSVERVFGYAVSELLGRQITILMPEYLRHAHEAGIGRYIQTGRKHINWESVELSGLHKSGREIPLELSFGQFSKGGKRFFTGIARDITERKRVEEMQVRRAAQMAMRSDINAALAESNAPLQRILEHCVEAMVSHLDAAFARIWTLNKEEDMLELQASAGMYTHIDGPHARVSVGALKIGLIAQERKPHITNDVQTDPRVNDKEWAKLEGMIAFAGYPLIVEDRLVGVMAMFARQRLASDTLDALASLADIISQGIERKRAEEALHASEEQLRQSQKLEAVGQLAGGVAHDFNNLLTVITGYSDLTLRRLDNESPFRSSLEEIKKAGERAASLTRQLLAFSRKQVLQPKVLQLNAIVADVDKMLRRLIGEDIDVLTVLEPSLGQIKADPGQIEQVILNLAVNARDAMPQGGKLTIETANVYLDNQYARRHTAIQPGNYVMLAVSDTGCGINAETQVRMFEPFFTTKEQGKGTGLGLSTVYGIVSQSGGHLWVYSEVGRGTTFKIYLPRVDGVTEGDEACDTPAELPQGRETVLLTEDEEQVRQMIRMILEMSGYRVLEAASGEEALAIYKQHEGQIDLVMTDVVMPQMSGRELAQSLEVLHPGIKVLYMSGYTDDAIVRHGLLDQEIAFLQKPFTPDVLMRKVRGVLDAPHED
jgi:two-component system cell cycle sensor histidine kinase/response regulator CckA